MDDLTERLRAALVKQLRASRKLREARAEFDSEVSEWGSEVKALLADARRAGIDIPTTVAEIERQLDAEDACTKT